MYFRYKNLNEFQQKTNAKTSKCDTTLEISTLKIYLLCVLTSESLNILTEMYLITNREIVRINPMILIYDLTRFYFSDMHVFSVLRKIFQFEE